MRKTVVITGSTRGIGYALAKEFLVKHMNVVINGTSKLSVEKALKSLGSYGVSDRLIGVPGDVADYETHQALIKTSIERFGHIDYWINNAGINQQDELFFEHPNEEIQKLVNVNIVGVIYGTKAAYNHMELNDGGYIYNMEGFGSDGRIMPKLSIYGTSKRALRYASNAFAREIESSRVKIGTLSPGMVATDFIKVTLKKDDQEAKRRKKFYNILADTPEDVASFLVERILRNKRNNVRIMWLTTIKVFWRFLLAPFSKRDLF